MSLQRKYVSPVRGESVNISEFVGRHETVTDDNEVRKQKAPHVIASVDVLSTMADTA